MKIKSEFFNCIKEDNSEEEQQRQWNHSRPIFEEFEKYLKNKGYNDSLIERQIGYSSFFVMNYYFIYEDGNSILETDEEIIRKFLGNWYIRKNWTPNIKEIKEILSSLFDFFEFIQKHNLISKESFEEIKNVCKDKVWFEKRLETYKTAEGEAFREWIEEYNYDW